MGGQEAIAWANFKYEGATDDTDYQETFKKRLREEKRYDYALEREWNKLYSYED